MTKAITKLSVSFFLILYSFSCTGQLSKQEACWPKDKATILIPFLPGSCHQCNAQFYRNLKQLEEERIEYSILLSEDYSEDLEYIKKEYNLSAFKVKDYIFSSVLYDAYHIYEQNYVLQYGVDSNYRIYDNTDALIKDLKGLNDAEILPLGDYVLKKSTYDIIVNGKDQICVLSSIRQNAFDFIDLKNKRQALSVPFTEQQLLHNYILNFTDTSLARSKLNEVRSIKDIPNKNTFDQGIFHNDSLLIFSNHTYINSLVDSSLGEFMILNVYKNGQYLGARFINKEHLPVGYYVMPHFHMYNNMLYAEVIKNEIEADNPNYFIAMFELKNGVYQFKKMLRFTVPDIHKDVGYSFLELKFSGKYFMTSISNILFNLETEQTERLNIPVNKKIDVNDLINNFKGVDIVVQNINVQYPNLLITYFSKDDQGIGTNVILNYDLNSRNIVGKMSMPLDNSRFIQPDLLRFGYFIWPPQKGNNTYLIYKKLY